jgi:hypothetical protein
LDRIFYEFKSDENVAKMFTQKCFYQNSAGKKAVGPVLFLLDGVFGLQCFITFSIDLNLK